MKEKEPKLKHIDQETTAAESQKFEEPKTSTAVKPKEEEKEKDNKKNVCKNDITDESKFLNIKRGRKTSNETLEQINENLNNKSLQKISENVKTNNPTSMTTEIKDEITNMISQISSPTFLPKKSYIIDLKKLLADKYRYRLPLEKAIDYSNHAISINTKFGNITRDILCAIFINLKSSPKYNNKREQAQGDDRKEFLEYLYDKNFSQIMKEKNITFDTGSTLKDRWEAFLKEKKKNTSINSSFQVRHPEIKLIINNGELVNEEDINNNPENQI